MGCRNPQRPYRHGLVRRPKANEWEKGVEGEVERVSYNGRRTEGGGFMIETTISRDTASRSSVQF